MAKKKDKVMVQLVGKSADGVTGSMYYITFNDKQILLDCGLYQTSSDDILNQYKINHRNYKVPFADLDAVIVGHQHTDHFGIVPYLFRRGYTGDIYIPAGSKPLAKIMWEDSLKIFMSDCLKIEKRYGIKAEPLYEQSDIDTAYDHLIELPFGEEIVLFDDLTIRFYHAAHIVNAAQVRLAFKIGETVKYLNYTGDIGSDICKDYILPYEPLPYADAVIAECTYGGSNKSHKQKDREKDIEKIKTVINQCCQENTKKVVFGSFSLQRTQEILTELYKIYGNDESFSTPVLVDAPLAKKVSNVWNRVIEKDSDLWKNVMSWKNIEWVDTSEDSMAWQKLKTSQIVISTSNFLKAGRILGWLKSILPDSENRLCFCGYSGDEKSVAYQIQHNKRWVEVDGVKISNRANVICLNSFSSHACQNELLKRYTDMPYNKIYLVHGEKSGKIEFAKKLRKSLSDADRSAKVHTPVMGDKISF
ncbi:MAG: MBL fold metallo-hydrolase [Methanobrevibacter sp.]|nr:MBL fold metallo-hydrolase [Methanobrevibacter sp.]